MLGEQARLKDGYIIEETMDQVRYCRLKYRKLIISTIHNKCCNVIIVPKHSHAQLPPLQEPRAKRGNSHIAKSESERKRKRGNGVPRIVAYVKVVPRVRLRPTTASARDPERTTARRRDSTRVRTARGPHDYAFPFRMHHLDRIMAPSMRTRPP